MGFGASPIGAGPGCGDGAAVAGPPPTLRPGRLPSSPAVPALPPAWFESTLPAWPAQLTPSRVVAAASKGPGAVSRVARSAGQARASLRIPTALKLSWALCPGGRQFRYFPLSFRYARNARRAPEAELDRAHLEADSRTKSRFAPKRRRTRTSSARIAQESSLRSKGKIAGRFRAGGLSSHVNDSTARTRCADGADVVCERL